MTALCLVNCYITHWHLNTHCVNLSTSKTSLSRQRSKLPAIHAGHIVTLHADLFQFEKSLFAPTSKVSGKDFC